MRTPDIPGQALEFLASILLGTCLGLGYDLLAAALPRRGRSAADGLFCLALLWSVRAFVMAGPGELRLFMLLGIAGGMVLHFCLLSEEIRPILRFWWGFCIIPGKFLCEIVRKLQKFVKKPFSF